MRVALSFFTIFPVRIREVTRGSAGRAMVVAPLIGVILGLVGGGIYSVLTLVGLPRMLAAGLTVAVGAVFTRGLHLDGLADTVDGLGAYTDSERALTIMRKPDIGPFGVVALVFTVLLQTFAISAIPPGQAALVGVASALGTGRLAATFACRRGVPPARPDGLGALVASSVPAPPLVIWTVALVALGAVFSATARWQGPLAVVLGLVASIALVRHAARRFGGITGDVLGAAIELTTTVTLVVLAVRR